MWTTIFLTPTSTANNCVAPSSPFSTTFSIGICFYTPTRNDGLCECLRSTLYIYVLAPGLFVLRSWKSSVSRFSVCPAILMLLSHDLTLGPLSSFPPAPPLLPPFLSLFSPFSLCPAQFRLWSAGFRFFASSVIYLCVHLGYG